MPTTPHPQRPAVLPRELMSFVAAIAGRYAIVREIGRGGMATVYLARDVKHDRLVALKLLDPRLGAVLGVERFLAEIKLTANLQHPSLLPLFDSGEADGQLFYVMPYIEGESLRARLGREKQLPVDEALRIAVAVANGLQYAHEHGVIHRDLKPENILIQAGQPVVADFGIALAVSNAAGERITQSGISLGTPQYMSPEQAAGDRTLDARSDIYSLGAVIYEMLMGEPPHTGSTVQAIMARVLHETPRSIRLTRQSVPDYVDSAIGVALEKVPADRWQTAREFSDALAGRVVRTPARGTVATAAIERRPASGWRVRAPLGMGFVLTALAGVGLGSWIATQREKPATPVRFTLTLDSAERIALVSVPFAVSPDGMTIVYVGIRNGQRQQLYARRLDDYRGRAVPGTEGASTPFFSPDGRSVGFVVGGRLSKVSLDNGTVVQLAEVGAINGASWSRDLIAIGTSEGLSVVPATGGAVRNVTKINRAAGESRQWHPRILDDGKTILYSSYSGASGYRLAAASIETGKTVVFSLAGSSALGVIDGQVVYSGVNKQLMATPFDPRGPSVGIASPVLDQVQSNSGGTALAALSASGTLVYLSGSNTDELVAATPGGKPRTLMPARRAYATPRFSPDGKRIAVTIRSDSAAEIWLYDVATGGSTRLTTGGATNDRAEWTPDGKRIVFRSNRGGPSALWWQVVDGSDSAQQLLGMPAPTAVMEGIVSPDSRFIIYRAGVSGSHLWVRNLRSESAAVQIAGASNASEQCASISRDGRWLAYESDEPGRNEVYIRPFPALNSRFQVSLRGGRCPVWSRDGQKLFYVTGKRLVAATLRLEPTPTVLKRDTLFDGALRIELGRAPFDVSPDGKEFIFSKPTGDEAQAIVVLNWGTELRARLGGKTP